MGGGSLAPLLPAAATLGRALADGRCRRSAAAGAVAALARQRRRDDPVGLEAQAQPLPVLALEGIETGEVLHAVQAVGDGVAVAWIAWAVAFMLQSLPRYEA